MGSCLSKKGYTSTSSAPASAAGAPAAADPNPNKSSSEVEKKKENETVAAAEEESVKKEIFIIKQRKSHDRRSPEEKGGLDVGLTCSSSTANNTTITTTVINSDHNNSSSNVGVTSNGIVAVTAAAAVRTSSCSKEEVDAILIQCGRLSRSSSGKASASCDTTNTNPLRGTRKYSGSKRSYDFDHHGPHDIVDNNKGNSMEDNDCDDDNDDGDDRDHRQRHRHRHRQSQSRPSSHGRRRTPSRERDQLQPQQQQRSGSRDRGGCGGGSGRRVSRSPGRRSETSITSVTIGATTPSSATATNSSNSRPGKMVSVPPTVMTDRSNNVGGGAAEFPTNGSIKRVLVKRNNAEAVVSSSRTAASPRSRSPANARVSNENHQNAHSNHHQQPSSLSRSSSRKAEQSPYRRNPMNEIDTNSLGSEPPPPCNKAANNINNRVQYRKEIEGGGQVKEPSTFLSQKSNVETNNDKVVVQGTNNKISSRAGALDNNVVSLNFRAKEQQQQVVVEEAEGPQPITGNVAVTTVSSGAETLKPQPLTRSRSSRRSRDLDLNPETLLNPPPASYTALLLEDIQNFHQKNATSFSLPPCVTKACSILEAVADLNSCTSSNLSCSFSEDRRSPAADDQFDNNFLSGTNPVRKKKLEAKDPFVESEVVVGDDLMEPSLHKYVTMRRGTVGVGEMEEQESSGSNSIVGGQQNWGSSSWEPNSADSTDCWTSSRSNTREEDTSPLGFQRHALSESGRDMDEGRRKRLSGKKRDSDHQQSRFGRGGVGATRGLHTSPTIAAAST